ncbi:phosphatase PAP2 family protein [Spongisporangium articulatum]|uniref:Phosphatase PAP2 family protein n=1 Tax=Spongisporangium articulatum TaxID=3362603 RepID=A0ABW8AR19_9ACTN
MSETSTRSRPRARAALAFLRSEPLLAVTLGAGLTLVLLLTAAAAEVYDAVVEADGVASLDPAVLQAAVSLRTPAADRIITDYTWLGGTVGMPVLATVAALTLAAWWRWWLPPVLTLITGLGSLAMTMVGKAVVARPRPPFADAVPPFETTYSFPSGHALNAWALAGIVAYLVVIRQRRTWSRTLTVAVAGGFAVTMGLTRIYLGHHWLTDVLVAWLLATSWLAVVIMAHRVYVTRRAQSGYRQQPGLIVG